MEYRACENQKLKPSEIHKLKAIENHNLKTSEIHEAAVIDTVRPKGNKISWLGFLQSAPMH